METPILTTEEFDELLMQAFGCGGFDHPDPNVIFNSIVQ